MAFLEVITRCYKRPQMLANNQASMQALTDKDWVQTLLIDEVGIGVGASQLRLRDNVQNLTGDYIWLLDDDDMAVWPTLISELRQIVADHDPDVIMLRMDHGPRGIQPDDAHWERRPVIGHVGCSAYVIRRPVWQDNAQAWHEKYSADGEFIQAIYDGGYSFYWHDVIASRVQRISLGVPE